MTTENKLLELNRKAMKVWNNSRAKKEAAGLEKFYTLRRLFHPHKPINK